VKIRKAFVVLNTRIEITPISKSSGRQISSIGSVEVVGFILINYEQLLFKDSRIGILIPHSE
jgi:hypothetical protein